MPMLQVLSGLRISDSVGGCGKLYLLGDIATYTTRSHTGLEADIPRDDQGLEILGWGLQMVATNL